MMADVGDRQEPTDRRDRGGLHESNKGTLTLLIDEFW